LPHIDCGEGHDLFRHELAQRSGLAFGHPAPCAGCEGCCPHPPENKKGCLMTTDFPSPHARAFKAAAAVPPETIEQLLVTVSAAVKGSWTYDMLREAFRSLLSEPIVAPLPVLWTVRTEPVNPADPDGPLRVVFFADQASAPKSWATLRTLEEAIVWISAATEEQLGEMAARLLADRPLSRAEVVPQQAILLATLASEKLSRRVMRAAQAAAHPKRRSRRRAVDQGDQE
jgi:hypothetical protein